MAELTEELRVLVTAEVDKAIKNLQNVDKQTESTEKLFKSLGKTITGALSIKALTDFTSKSVAANKVQKESVNVLNSVLDTTGATAWTSAIELQEMAASLQSVSNYGDETTLSMQSVLLGFKNIKGDTFEEATKAILDMATVMHMDLSSAAQVVGKALDDPVNGLTSLSRQGFKFTDAQKQVIQSLLDTGDAAGAQKVILDELNATYGGAAEAAADLWTQTQNSIGDLYEGYGKLFTKFVEGTGVLSKFKDAVDYLSDAVNNFDQYAAYAFGGESYKNWFNNLSDTEKLKEAGKQLDLWQEKYKKAQESGNSKAIDEATVCLDLWRKQKNELLEIVTAQQEAQRIENERSQAESDLYEVIASVTSEFEKLSKDDPAEQLKSYNRQLDEIVRKRKQLQTQTFDKDGNLIDTSKALSQLDYVEKKIREKSKALQSDGKKSWQDWLSSILGVDKSLFTTGKQAADLYIQGLTDELTASEELSKALGEQFSKTEYLDSQLESLKKKIQEALSIDPSQINEAFDIQELTNADTALGHLVVQYKELKAAKDGAFVSDEIKRMETEVDNLTKSERELYIIRLKNAGATEEEIEYALWLSDVLNANAKASDEAGDHTQSLSEKIGAWVENSLNELDLLDEKSNKVIGNLASSLSDIAFDAVLDGFEAFGEALGEGEDAAESLQAALAAMAQSILDQLPTLFLQAGLQLIAQGQWALGLGFIAAAGSSAIVSGYVSGATSSDTEENALGGVYGDSAYKAFAKGGTFTNAIVTSPTFFKFAKGSGFGTGLMGEAGPEAVMPLTRGADGSLGVDASGLSGGDYSLTVIVNNYGSEEVTTEETTDEETGSRTLEITIGAVINSHIANGKADKALKNRYGLKVQGV